MSARPRTKKEIEKVKVATERVAVAAAALAELQKKLADIEEAASKAGEDDKDAADLAVSEVRDEVAIAIAAHVTELENLAEVEAAADAPTPSEQKKLDAAKSAKAAKSDEGDDEVCLQQFIGSNGMNYPGDKVPNDQPADLELYRIQGLIGRRTGPATPPVRK